MRASDELMATVQQARRTGGTGVVADMTPPLGPVMSWLCDRIAKVFSSSSDGFDSVVAQLRDRVRVGEQHPSNELQSRV